MFQSTRTLPTEEIARIVSTIAELPPDELRRAVVDMLDAFAGALGATPADAARARLAYLGASDDVLRDRLRAGAAAIREAKP
jgi:hypothetical protein